MVCSKHYATAFLILVCPCLALGQALPQHGNAALPDSPGFLRQAQGFETGEAQGTAQVQGTVQDTQGNPIPGATVVLTAPGKLGDHTAIAGSDGSFVFTGLPQGDFFLIVTAAGLAPYTSPEFAVRAGATVQAPKIALKLATSSSVNVYASSEQIAQAQIQEQQQQRVFGVFQNFYTSYIWKAAPMSTGQKYKLALRTQSDPTTFLVVAGVAGAEQYNGTYPGYGSGIEGYGKRYGAALADATTGRFIGSAILPSLLHQDPRYFYQGAGGIRSRAWHAVASAFICRGDNGRLEPNYSHLLGNLAAGGIANAYHPASSRGVGLTFETLGVTTAGNMVGNLFREFLLRDLEPSVPRFAHGKP
ncbi:carboxypeptidase-like regulatory domain-containing protein [Edaphobacter acidisoli]|nr:carboxypeptidase-like regulatory domain-containing protein [Edaphobacter acidisoli]